MAALGHHTLEALTSTPTHVKGLFTTSTYDNVFLQVV